MTPDQWALLITMLLVCAVMGVRNAFVGVLVLIVGFRLFDGPAVPQAACDLARLCT